jgi:hypothetical protein
MIAQRPDRFDLETEYESDLTSEHAAELSIV